MCSTQFQSVLKTGKLCIWTLSIYPKCSLSKNRGASLSRSANKCMAWCYCGVTKRRSAELCRNLLQSGVFRPLVLRQAEEVGNCPRASNSHLASHFSYLLKQLVSLGC